MTFLLLTLTTLVLAWLVFKTRLAPRLKWARGGHLDGESAYSDHEPAPQFRLQTGFDASFAPPDALPIKTRQHFFAPSESSLYTELIATLAGTTYRVFPNVRLDNIFQPVNDASSPSAQRLHEQVVGFLVVATPEFRPVLGLVLEGHAYGESQLRDERHRPRNERLTTLAFRSARLPLLHIDAQRNIDADALQKLITPHLMQT